MHTIPSEGRLRKGIALDEALSNWGTSRTIQAGSVLGGLIAWELIAGQFSKFILPPPSAVLGKFLEPGFTAQLLTALGYSLQQMLLGFGLALLVAIPMGMLMGRMPRVNALLDPIVNAIYAIPTISYVPFFVIWFGLFFPSRVALVFVMAFIDILVVVVAGARDVRSSLIDVGRSFGATRIQLATKVVVPAMMPFLMTAVRVGLARSINGMITAELFFAAVNLGGIMKTASRTFDSAGVLAVVVLICLLGLVGQYLVAALESRILHWKLKA